MVQAKGTYVARPSTMPTPPATRREISTMAIVCKLPVMILPTLCTTSLCMTFQAKPASPFITRVMCLLSYVHSGEWTSACQHIPALALPALDANLLAPVEATGQQLLIACICHQVAPTTRIQVSTLDRDGMARALHMLYTAANGPIALDTSLAPCATLIAHAEKICMPACRIMSQSQTMVLQLASKHSYAMCQELATLPAADD